MLLTSIRRKLISFKNISLSRFYKFYNSMCRMCKNVKLLFLKLTLFRKCNFELEVYY